MARKKVVAVIGTGHCGSTLMDLILGSHTSARSLGELVSLNWHESGASGKLRWKDLCGVCRHDCRYWPTVASDAVIRRYFEQGGRLRSYIRRGSQYHRSIYDHFFDWTGADLLIDSSKKPYWFRKQLRHPRQWNDKESFLIYVTRDGRAVVNSYYRKYPERGFEPIVKDWKRRVEDLNRYYDSFPASKRYEVRYEDLASAPQHITEDVCRFLGIPYEQEMLRFWRHDHHLIGGNLGTRSLICRYREQFRDEPQRRGPTQELRERHGTFYDQVGLAIELDERWRREFGEGECERFQALTGDMNQRFRGGS